MKKHLRSARKLVTEQEKEHCMETWEMCFSLGSLALVNTEQEKEHVKAKEYYEKALAISTEIGDRAGEGTCGPVWKPGKM